MDNHKHTIGNQIILVKLLELISDDIVNENLDEATLDLRSALLSFISNGEDSINLANEVNWSRNKIGKIDKSTLENENVFEVGISVGKSNTTIREFISDFIYYIEENQNIINSFLETNEKYNFKEFKSYLDLIFYIISATSRFEYKNYESPYHPFDSNLLEAVDAFNNSHRYRLSTFKWNYDNIINGPDSDVDLEEFKNELKKRREVYYNIIKKQNRK